MQSSPICEQSKYARALEGERHRERRIKFVRMTERIIILDLSAPSSERNHSNVTELRKSHFLSSNGLSRHYTLIVPVIK